RDAKSQSARDYYQPMQWGGLLRRHICRRSPLLSYQVRPISFRNQRVMAAKPLGFHDGPLVWVDCEMTGLDPRKDKILEIAVIITNGNLEPMDEGIEYTIRTDKSVLDGMNEWCIYQHRRSGLTQACLESTHSHTFVYNSVLAYIKRWIPHKRTACLAGNSIHADRAF
ncbi:putative oligoribonuclease, partial [Termitomyces sp. T112]